MSAVSKIFWTCSSTNNQPSAQALWLWNRNIRFSSKHVLLCNAAIVTQGLVAVRRPSSCHYQFAQPASSYSEFLPAC